MTIEQPIKITIRPLEPDHLGQPCAVLLNGEVVIPKEYLPVHEFCRRAVAADYNGTVEVWLEGECFPFLLVSSPAKAASLCETSGIYLVRDTLRYLPFDRGVYADEMQEPVWHQD